MKPGQIELDTSKHRVRHDLGSKSYAIKFALPFYKGFAAMYTHRIRKGKTIVRNGETSHVAFSFWCGGCGFIEPEGKRQKGEMLAILPHDAILCATCEGRAIGAGLVDSGQINGRDVMYIPRNKNSQ